MKGQATHTMQTQTLERMELIAVDTKKEFSYDKSTGNWSWSERGDDEKYGEFRTRLEALADAVEPYLGMLSCDFPIEESIS